MTELVSMLVPLQGTLPGWPVADEPTRLQELGLLIGVPAVLFVIVALLGKSRQLIRAARGEAAQAIDEPIWLGAAPAGRGELTAAGTVSVPGEGRRGIVPSEAEQQVGGSSARW